MRPSLIGISNIAIAGTLVLIFITTGLSSVTFEARAGLGVFQQRDEVLMQQYQNGVVSQVQIARAGNSLETVRQSVESVSSFINRRSGLTLSDDVKAKLTSMEFEALNDPQKRVGADRLAENLTRIAADRLASLTDDEIKHIRAIMNRAESDNDPNGILLRANGRGTMSPLDFDAAMPMVRQACRGGNAAFYQIMRRAIANEVNRDVELLDEYASTDFRSIKKLGLSPLQAFLITYSVAADDPLVHSQETLLAQEEAVYRMAPKAVRNGPPFVYAYGPEGYRFATPLDIALDDTTQQKLLESISQGTVATGATAVKP